MAFTVTCRMSGEMSLSQPPVAGLCSCRSRSCLVITLFSYHLSVIIQSLEHPVSAPHSGRRLIHCRQSPPRRCPLVTVQLYPWRPCVVPLLSCALPSPPTSCTSNTKWICATVRLPSTLRSAPAPPMQLRLGRTGCCSSGALSTVYLPRRFSCPCPAQPGASVELRPVSPVTVPTEGRRFAVRPSLSLHCVIQTTSSSVWSVFFFSSW